MLVSALCSGRQHHRSSVPTLPLCDGATRKKTERRTVLGLPGLPAVQGNAKRATGVDEDVSWVRDASKVAGANLHPTRSGNPIRDYYTDF